MVSAPRRGSPVDGRVGGRWKRARERGTVTLAIEPVVRLSKTEATDLTDEGTKLLAFLAPDVGTRDVRIARPAMLASKR